MNKQIGSVLLILGTCIGAAMLALPVVTAGQSFSLTGVLLLFAWAIMTVGAWTLLRVNLWMPEGANLITMTEKTLGKAMSMVTWVVYLLLLYSLICAYLAGASDLAQGLLGALKLPLYFWQASLLVTLVLGGVVYTGISSADYLNRALMAVKLGMFFVVVFALIPHSSLSNLYQGGFQSSPSIFMVMITSFGFAVILPSIRSYLGSDVVKLKRVVIIGSLIPLLIYLIWVAVVQSAIPGSGPNGLIAMVNSPHTITLLLKSLYALGQQHVVLAFGTILVSICALTSFLGVSICLMDFFADGFHLKRRGRQGAMIFLLTYAPPFLVVLLKPELFTTALAYAGIFCVYILIILPILMYVFGKKKYAEE
ncbi:MAG: tryptophan/tyrosine permease [Coxiellaceae bacterium]|nr:tryptophan/tyrosine permease [Coxiellaceae bacterium]